MPKPAPQNSVSTTAKGVFVVLGALGTLLTVGAVLFGLQTYLEDEYAKRTRLRKLEIRLDQKITQERIDTLASRIQGIREQIGEIPNIEELRQVLTDLDKQKMKLVDENDALSLELRQLKQKELD